MAVATEEQAVRMLYADEIDIINYDGPSLNKTWDIVDVRQAA